MFGIGMPEMILILAVALIVIGPKKLPDLAKSLGKAMREFKNATSEIKESFEMDDDVVEIKKNLNKLDHEPTAGSAQNDADADKTTTQLPDPYEESEPENDQGPEQNH